MVFLIIQDILSRLEGVRPSGDGWTAKCPAHDDKHASLSVGVGQDGKILLNCHAGCDIDRITYSLGIAKRDLFPNKNKSKVENNTIKLSILSVLGLNFNGFIKAHIPKIKSKLAKLLPITFPIEISE